LKKKIFFRADGNSKIGLGHVIRCLALVEILNNNFECVFLIHQPSDLSKKLIEKYCHLVALNKGIKDELSEISDLVGKNDILVLDGYNFDSSYQLAVKNKVKKLVMIDDQANWHYYTDLVINHGSSLIEKKYKKEDYTKVLTGFKYSILRKDFLLAARKQRQVSIVDTLFICFGGADPFNATVKVLQAAL